jgi:hypothetical protein
MKTLFLIFIFCAMLVYLPSAQHLKRNQALISEIDTMFKYDQFWRLEYIKIVKKEKSAYDAETIQEKWSEADSLNELKAKAIIKKHGYPGYDLVGDASDNFWAIVQHCDDDAPFQEHVLALMKIQIDKKNANKAKYAYLTDRILTNKNQKQIYGTQLKRDSVTGKFTPFPLKYPKTVNKLRKGMGLEPLEEYVRDFGL